MKSFDCDDGLQSHQSSICRKRGVKESWKSHSYDRINDLIVFKHPFHENKFLVKRIAARPGQVILNPKTGKRVIIPEGRVWVLSANPQHGSDSRDFGPVPLGLVIGKCSAIIWPPRRFTMF